MKRLSFFCYIISFLIVFSGTNTTVRIETAQSAAQAIFVSIPDTVVDDDWLGLPAGTTVFFPNDPNGHTIGVDAFSTINAAYPATPAGATIYIAPGTYTTNTVITKSISIVGSGNGNNPTTNTVVQNTTADIFVVQAANNVSLSNMFLTGLGASVRGVSTIGNVSNIIFSDLHITRCFYDAYFQYTTNADNIQFINCVFDFAQNSAFYFQTYSAIRQNAVINNLLVQDCVLSDSPYGIYVYQPPLNTFPLRLNDFRNIIFRNTRFERITYKGIYAERLQDALFDGITMIDCGTDPLYAYPNAININLKYADFTNITIQNSTFLRCGITEKSTTACLYIEGRADNAYATNPATLTNVNIINCLIDVSTRGLVEGKSTNVSVIQTQIYNCTMGLTTMGVTNFLMEKCVIMNNNRELLPFFTTADTYGVAIAGRLYPNTVFGPFFGSTNATIRSCVFCGHLNAGLANADEVLNVRQYGFIPSSVDARYNWWGANDGPSSFGPGHGDPIGPATITYDPWLVMSIASSTTQILVGSQTSTITVSMNTLSDGTPASSTIMDGVLDVTMSVPIGAFGNGNQTITVPMIAGQAQATFSSTSTIGTATVTAYIECNSVYATCTTSINVVGKALLEIRKTAKKFSLVKGESATFVIAVTNRGDVPAINVNLIDTYPKELVFVSSRPSGSQQINSVNFNIGTLLPGRQATYEITFELSNNVDLSSNKITLTNEAITTGYNFYNNEKTTAKDTAIITYSQIPPTTDMQINTIWKGLDVRNSIIGAGANLELQVSVEGCNYPCQISLDWGDLQHETKSLDNPGFVKFNHVWTTGEFKVVIKVSDAYGKTKFISRTVTVK